MTFFLHIYDVICAKVGACQQTHWIKTLLQLVNAEGVARLEGRQTAFFLFPAHYMVLMLSLNILKQVYYSLQVAIILM